jgi:hypothetical protein
VGSPEGIDRSVQNQHLSAKVNQMATVLIAHVATQTTGGYPAQVTGIDPTDHDCLVGTIYTPGAGEVDARWNNVGICRGKTDGCNLDVNTSDMTDVIKTAKKLGA